MLPTTGKGMITPTVIMLAPVVIKALVDIFTLIQSQPVVQQAEKDLLEDLKHDKIVCFALIKQACHHLESESSDDAHVQKTKQSVATSIARVKVHVENELQPGNTVTADSISNLSKFIKESLLECTQKVKVHHFWSMPTTHAPEALLKKYKDSPELKEPIATCIKRLQSMGDVKADMAKEVEYNVLYHHFDDALGKVSKLNTYVSQQQKLVEGSSLNDDVKAKLSLIIPALLNKVLIPMALADDMDERWMCDPIADIGNGYAGLLDAIQKATIHRPQLA